MVGPANVADRRLQLKRELPALRHGPSSFDILSLKTKVRSLEAKLRGDLRPALEQAVQASAEAKASIAHSQQRLEATSERRLAAAEEVRRISKQQLAEIRQLARHPAPVLKSSLLLLWLLLNSERFRGRSTVHVDEAKDWHKCVRMLRDEGFTAQILNYDPSVLEGAPHVVAHVESMMSFDPDDEEASSEVAGKRPRIFSRSRSLTQIQAPGDGAVQRRPSTSDSVCSLTSAPSRSRGACRWSFSSASDGAGCKPKAPLDVASVARACASCGVLVRWMQELVLEHRARRMVAQELAVAEASLAEADARRVAAEKAVAKAEAEVARIEFSLAAMEAECKRSEDVKSWQLQKAVLVNKALKALKNDDLNAAIRETLPGFDAEIVAMQVRCFKKLGPATP